MTLKLLTLKNFPVKFANAAFLSQSSQFFCIFFAGISEIMTENDNGIIID